MNEDKYYTVTFRNYPNAETYTQGTTALEAIDNARQALWEEGYLTPYLAPRARPTVYKEWNNNANQYRNDGTLTK